MLQFLQKGLTMAKKRHHHKEHLSKHDRMVDRENLMHGKHHESEHNPKYHHSPASYPGTEYERHSAERYSGMESRRTQEMQDAGMIRENPSAIANLPQEVMIKAYPMSGPYMPEGLDDSIRGVDGQMDYDDSQRRKTMYPKKV